MQVRLEHACVACFFLALASCGRSFEGGLVVDDFPERPAPDAVVPSPPAPEPFGGPIGERAWIEPGPVAVDDPAELLALRQDDSGLVLYRIVWGELLEAWREPFSPDTPTGTTYTVEIAEGGRNAAIADWGTEGPSWLVDLETGHSVMVDESECALTFTASGYERFFATCNLFDSPMTVELNGSVVDLATDDRNGSAYYATTRGDRALLESEERSFEMVRAPFPARTVEWSLAGTESCAAPTFVGSALYACRRDAEGTPTVWRYQFDGRSTSLSSDLDLPRDAYFVVSPGGRSVATYTWREADPLRVFELTSGELTDDTSGVAEALWSPDGAAIAGYKADDWDGERFGRVYWLHAQELVEIDFGADTNTTRAVAFSADAARVLYEVYTEEAWATGASPTQYVVDAHSGEILGEAWPADLLGPRLPGDRLMFRHGDRRDLADR